MVVKLMRKILFFIVMISSLFLISCSDTDGDSPEEVIERYIHLWEQHEFTDMYTMLTEETKELYPTEEFIERYEKIYKDLQIKDLTIDISSTDYNDENSSVTFPLDISMDSVAGPIEFSEEITLESFIDKEEEIDSWLVEWNPNLIFPELADGGKIRVETTEPNRGEILDRNDMPLAINDIAYEVGIVPENFSNKDAEIEQLASLLYLSESNIKNTVEADWVEADHFVPLKTVPIADKKTVEQLEKIPAVSMRETTGRTYPSSEAISHLVGYIGTITEEELKEAENKSYKDTDFIGKRGLEKLYEQQLKGESGVKILIESKDEKGDPIHSTLTEKPVQHGENIQVTIDINLQELLYEQYENKLKGAATAIHPTTGEILALVSSPSYDPIPLTYGISQSDWDALMNDKRQPFVNRFTATYAPGSVIKPVVGMIGLNNGSITHDEGLTIEGLTWQKDNWEDFYVSRVSTSNGPVTLDDALIRSDNIYFAMKGVEMGNEKMVEGLQAFGFDESLPLEYPFSTSQISNSGHLKNEALRANTAYGQGEIEVNALHMALLYTPLLNEGNLVKPILLTSETKGENWQEDLISKNDIKKIKASLRKVVTEGTATAIKDEKLDISGKTGTVELKATREDKGHENAWFIGYPTEDEDIIVAMLVEEAENIGTSGFAAKKVANVLNKYKKLK